MTRILAPAYAPLRGEVVVPGDKSLAHRAVLLPLLAAEPCRVRGWLAAKDTLSSLAAVQELGAWANFEAGVLMVNPPTRDRPVRPANQPLTIDCGNSGTTCRLLLGLLSGWLDPGDPAVVLTGDDSLTRRPMARIVDPLQAMGASLQYLQESGRLPIQIESAVLRGCEHTLTVPSAQVKSALLLAGLRASGRTTLRGAVGSRDHTERLLARMGCLIQGDGLHEVSVAGGGYLAGFDLEIPGDPSAAAFFQVAAALVPGSRVEIKGQSLNPRRTGLLRVLERAGAEVRVRPRNLGRAAPEPVGDVAVASARLQGFSVGPAEVPDLIDELPVLAVLATQAPGRTVVRGAADLRHKECDRIAVMARALNGLGARVTERDDGWEIIGPTPLNGGQDTALILGTDGDHRVAMALAIAGLIAKGQTALDAEDCVAVSFPDFFATLEALRTADGGRQQNPGNQ